jgi:ABC-2 type transport system permease protein
MGTQIGDSAVIAIAWCVAIALAVYLWARTVFNRGSSR